MFMVAARKLFTNPLGWMGFLLMSIIGLYSCVQHDDRGMGPLPVELNLESHRLDRDLHALDTNDLHSGLVRLKEKYGPFIDFYLDTLMGFGLGGDYRHSNPAVHYGLKVFLSHPDYRGVLDTVAVHFPEVAPIEKELGMPLRRWLAYFPEQPVPTIYYLVTGLNNWGAFTYHDDLAIGLDMFLGAEYPFYASVGIPAYMERQLRPEYIPIAVMRTLHQKEYPFVQEGKTLLDMMIQRGKEQYFLEKVLREWPLEQRLGYSKEQLNWCQKHEAMVYHFFVNQQLLYETNWQRIIRYVNEGQHSTGMPAESPGNIGSWLGYRIVKSYMDQHPDMTLVELLDSVVPAQVFLQDSKYKPK